MLCLHHLGSRYSLWNSSHHGNSGLTHLVEVVRQICTTHDVVGCLGTGVQQVHLGFFPGCVGFTAYLVRHRHSTLILLINDSELIIGMRELRRVNHLGPRGPHLRRRRHMFRHGIHLTHHWHLIIIPRHCLSTVHLGDRHRLAHHRCLDSWHGCLNPRRQEINVGRHDDWPLCWSLSQWSRVDVLGGKGHVLWTVVDVGCVDRRRLLYSWLLDHTWLVDDSWLLHHSRLFDHTWLLHHTRLLDNQWWVNTRLYCRTLVDHNWRFGRGDLRRHLWLIVKNGSVAVNGVVRILSGQDQWSRVGLVL